MLFATRNRLKFGLASLVGFGLAAAPIIALPSVAAGPAGTGVVISEAYLNGGSANATYLNKFVELYNPTDAAITLEGTSLQYRSASGVVNPTTVVPLTGSVPAKGHFLFQGSSNGTTGAALPTPDASSNAGNFAGGGGTLFLASQATALVAPVTGSLINAPGVLDLLGYGGDGTRRIRRRPEDGHRNQSRVPDR